MYGNSSNIVGTGSIYNITSLKEGFQRLPALIPPIDFKLRYIDRDFDMAYAQYIMNNDYVFCQFFAIIFDLYLGKDVYLMMDTSEDWSENIVESLLKLIQQRYGYNAYRIDSYDDYQFAYANNISEFDKGYGLMNLDQDKERYTMISEINRIRAGGKVDLGD